MNCTDAERAVWNALFAASAVAHYDRQTAIDPTSPTFYKDVIEDAECVADSLLDAWRHHKTENGCTEP